MAEKSLKVQTAFVGVKEKLKDRFLFVDKIPKNDGGDSFVFYIVEILNPWHPSIKIEKIINQNIAKNLSLENKFDFEDTLRQINEELGIIANKGETDWIGNLNAIIGYIENSDTLHLSMSGNLLGYIIRNNKIITLTEGLGSDDPTNPLKTFENITSGKLSQGDQIILANILFYDYLSIDRLRRLLIENSAKKTAREIHRLLRKSRAKEISAAIFDAKDKDNSAPDDDCREFYWLDQAVETPFNKFIKTAKPIALNITQSSNAFLKKTYESSKNKVYATSKKWNSNKQSNLKKTVKIQSTQKIIAKNSSDDSKPSSHHQNLKVKSYRQKSQNKINLSKIQLYIFDLYRLIKPIFKKQNRRYLYIFLAVILITVGYLKIRANNANRELLSSHHQLEDSLNKASDLYNTAKEDIALGKEGGIDKLNEALKIADTALENPRTKDTAFELRKKVLDLMDESSKTVRIWSIDPIFEIKGEITKSILVGETIYSITSEGRVYSTDTRDNTPSLIASIDSDSGKVIDLAFSDSTDKIYIYKDNNKVFALEASSETVDELNISNDLGWENATSLDAYVTNLYLLDSSSGEVWKHTYSNGSFSKGSAYLDTRNVSIKDAVDLAIEGNIFVLLKNGDIKKFIKGSYDEDFVLGSVPPPYEAVDSPKQIYTDSDTNYIFVLDSSKNRVIKYEKNGTYSNQYAFESLSTAELLINPRVQKLWIRSDNKYYELSI